MEARLLFDGVEVERWCAVMCVSCQPISSQVVGDALVKAGWLAEVGLQEDDDRRILTVN